jgi:hypothetical protein
MHVHASALPKEKTMSTQHQRHAFVLGSKASENGSYGPVALIERVLPAEPRSKALSIVRSRIRRLTRDGKLITLGDYWLLLLTPETTYLVFAPNSGVSEADCSRLAGTHQVLTAYSLPWPNQEAPLWTETLGTPEVILRHLGLQILPRHS